MDLFPTDPARVMGFHLAAANKCKFPGFISFEENFGEVKIHVLPEYFNARYSVGVKIEERPRHNSIKKYIETGGVTIFCLEDATFARVS